MKSSLPRLLPLVPLILLLAGCGDGTPPPVGDVEDSAPPAEVAEPATPAPAPAPAPEPKPTAPEPKPAAAPASAEPKPAPPATAAPAPSPAPAKDLWVHDTTDIEPDSNVIWASLPTGLRYAILPNSEPPDRVSLRLYVDAGSLMEEDDQQGLAHFLEHMAFNGTKNYPAGEMVEYFQRLGMAFGSHTNAHTSFKETVYKLELPDAKPGMLDDGFKLLRDYSDGLLFGEAEIERERGVILSEKRSRDSADWRAFVDWIGFALPEGRIAKRLPIGQEDVISKAPRQRFIEFYQKWYTPDRMAVVVVGDVDPKQIEGYITEHFDDLKSTGAPVPDPALGELPKRGVATHVYSDEEASETQVSIETVRPTTFGPDSQARRARELRSRLASAIISRRLEILSKKEGAVVIRGSTHHNELFDLPFCEYASIDATCKPENWAAALSVIDQELRRALQFGFSEAELTEARAKLQNQLEVQAKSAVTRKSSELADLLVTQVGSGRVFTHPQSDLERVTPLLASITTEECLDAVRDIWGDLEQVVVYASGNVKIPGGEQAVLDAYKSSLGIAVEALEEKEMGEFAYTQEREPGEIASRVEVEDLEITQIRFANNVRANFKVTDFEDNKVYVSARIGAGRLTEPADKPGLAMFVGSTFSQGGLEAHSADDLKQLLAGRTVGAGLGVGDDAFELGGVTTPEDFELQLQLMRAYLTEPGYRDEAAREFANQLDQVYSQLAHTPDGVLGNEVTKLIHSGDRRFGYPEQAVLASRNLAEAREWLTPALDSAYLEISVVGDFDPAIAIDLVAREFGSLPQRAESKPPLTDERLVKFPAGVNHKEFEFESEIPKSIAVVYWPTTDMSDIAKTRRLGLLSSVMRDRLRIKVREELGDAYSPYARNTSSETFTGYGYLFGYVEAAPAQAEPLADVIQSIGADLAANGISTDELERANLPTLTMIEEYRRTNEYWLNMVVGPSQEFPMRLEWARNFVTDYKSITEDELSALAKEYLAPEKALQILISPEAPAEAPSN